VAFFAFQRYVAAVRFNGPSSDGQSKACTTPFSRSCTVNPVEAVKDMRLMFAGNSRPLVDHI
jgi:hypothetical protein